MGSEICWNKAFAEQTLPGENSLWPDQWSSGNVGHQQWGTEMVVWESITLSDNGILSEWIFPKNKAWVLFILQDQNNNNGEKKKNWEFLQKCQALLQVPALAHIVPSFWNAQCFRLPPYAPASTLSHLCPHVCHTQSLLICSYSSKSQRNTISR